jgi:tetratricopeptide (TPR) repeat protein
MSLEELAAAFEKAFERNDHQALSVALEAANSMFPAGSEMPLPDLARLAGLLIDAGSALRLPDPIKRGRALFQEEWERLKPVYGSAQLHYNVANAWQSLYDIERTRSGWRFNLEGTALSFEAKSAYWRSLAESPVGRVTPQLLTNLGNALDASGRVVDALYYYERALAASPQFGMANCNRGLALLYLNRVSGAYSVKLMYEMYRSFDAARKSQSSDAWAKETSEREAERIAQAIREHGHEPTEDHHSVEQSDQEERLHDPYWSWCLQHSLALSEHALYCRCIGARRDDLSILRPGTSLSGSKVPKMELLLNRMKSEYCLSRALLFQSVAPERKPRWDLTPFEGTFTDLMDDEEIGMETELLRTSFRLCFGILDRVARGVCEFLGLAREKETIYFHRFWHSPRKDGDKRWAALNEIEGPGLVALYGLARDLNERDGGEWSRLKRYRNLFEHELCLIRKDSKSRDLPPWLDDKDPPSIPYEQMKSDAADMLRFTRAAIFCFTFLVRSRSRGNIDGPGGPAITFPKKPIGKD